MSWTEEDDRLLELESGTMAGKLAAVSVSLDVLTMELRKSLGPAYRPVMWVVALWFRLSRAARREA